jgi:hypothetical protein
MKATFSHEDLGGHTDFTQIEIPSIDKYPNESINELSLTYDLVTNPVQAQLLGFIELKQARVDKVVQFKTDYSKLGIKAGDIIDITNSVYSWTNQKFRVISTREVDGSEGNIDIELTCLEYDASVYDESNLNRFIRSGANGLYDSSIIPAPRVPDIIKYEDTTIPSITCTTSLSGGLVDEVEFWITEDVPPTVNDDTLRNYSFMTKAVPTLSANVFALEESITVDVPGMSAKNFMIKCRAKNAFGVSPYSDPSGLIAYDPKPVTGIDPNASIDGNQIHGNIYGNVYGDVYGNVYGSNSVAVGLTDGAKAHGLTVTHVDNYWIIGYGDAPGATPLAGDPVADFAAYDCVDTDFTIRFYWNGNSGSTLIPTSYLWDFGDGTTSTELSPRHTFTGANRDRFLVKLTVEPGGATSQQYFYITTASHANPSSAFLILIDNTADYGFNFYYTGDGVPTSYLWDFGDGTTSTDPQPYHAYTNGNIAFYSVTLTVQPGGAGSMGYARPKDAVVTGPHAPVASAVDFTGARTVGTLLTGNYTYSDLDGDPEGTSTFRWLRGNTVIGNAITYTATGADAGTEIQFEVTPVTANAAPYVGRPASSSPTTISWSSVQQAPTAASVSVLGNVVVGDTVTGSYVYIDPNGDPEGASTFRWLRDYTTVVGNSTTYTTVTADVGLGIQFEVTPVSTVAPFTGNAVASLPRTITAAGPSPTAPVASNVRISGNTIVGRTLSGYYTYTDINGDTEGATTYRWLSGNTVVGTGNSYTTVTGDIDQPIKFEVTPVSIVAPFTGNAVQSAATYCAASYPEFTPYLAKTLSFNPDWALLSIDARTDDTSTDKFDTRIRVIPGYINGYYSPNLGMSTASSCVGVATSADVYPSSTWPVSGNVILNYVGDMPAPTVGSYGTDNYAINFAKIRSDYPSAQSVIVEIFGNWFKSGSASTQQYIWLDTKFYAGGTLSSSTGASLALGSPAPVFTITGNTSYNMGVSIQKSAADDQLDSIPFPPTVTNTSYSTPIFGTRIGYLIYDLVNNKTGLFGNIS